MVIYFSKLYNKTNMPIKSEGIHDVLGFTEWILSGSDVHISSSVRGNQSNQMYHRLDLNIKITNYYIIVIRTLHIICYHVMACPDKKYVRHNLTG